MRIAISVLPFVLGGVQFELALQLNKSVSSSVMQRRSVLLGLTKRQSRHAG